MSETLLETAQNTTEAGSSTEPAAASATAEANEGTTQQTSSEQPAAAAETTEQQPAAATVPEGAPEKYEFTAPEGAAYDPQVLTTFTEAARAANLTQDAAQKLLGTMAPALAARQAEQIAAVRETWANETKSDKDFGGDKLAGNMQAAVKSLKTFDASGEMRKLLEDTGLGNHRTVLRFLRDVGAAVSEDGFVAGRGSMTSQPRATANVFYGETTKG